MINTLIVILSVLLVIGFACLSIVTYIVRNNAQSDLKTRCETGTAKAYMVHAGCDTGCSPANKEVILKWLDSVEFKDNNGHVLSPDDYNLYVVAGECMQYVNIHSNDLVFATKGFDAESYDWKLPIILAMKKRTNSPGGPTLYKLRRSWTVCNYQDNLKGILESILQSPYFQEVRQRPNYDGDEELIKDFFDTRLKRYENDYIKCGYPNKSDERIIISTTFHTDIGRVRFSIHPISNIVGKVVAAFPIDSKHISAA